MSLIAGLLVKWRIAGKSLGAPMVRPEGIRRLQFEQFPVEARGDLQPAIDDAIASGLRAHFYYQTVPENEFKSEDVARAAALVSDDYRLYGVLAWVRIQRTAEVLKQTVTAVRKRSDFQCLSLLTTGEVLMTSNRRLTFDGLPHVSAERIVDGSPADIIAFHRRRLTGIPQDQILRVSDAELEDVLVQQMQKRFNGLIRRGLFVPVSGPSREEVT